MKTLSHDPCLLGPVPTCLSCLSAPPQIHLRLLVLCGSLDEEADQRGAAHFVEHLAFRGTLKFDQSSVYGVLSALGARLG